MLARTSIEQLRNSRMRKVIQNDKITRSQSRIHILYMFHSPHPFQHGSAARIQDETVHLHVTCYILDLISIYPVPVL